MTSAIAVSTLGLLSGCAMLGYLGYLGIVTLTAAFQSIHAKPKPRNLRRLRIHF